MAGTSWSFLAGPLVGLLVVGVFVLVLRWAFSPKPTSVAARPVRKGAETDYGMLVPVSAPPTYVEGEMLRRTLEDRGIRATLAMTNDGPRVMVFPGDEERARDVLT